MSVKVSMKVNGKPVSADLEARTLLVTFIREQPAAHRHPRRLRYGAVRRVHCPHERQGDQELLDRRHASEGADILTIEGVARPTARCTRCRRRSRRTTACNAALHAGHGDERARLREKPSRPTEEEVRDSLEGNLCRCTGYHNIVKSIMAGARAMAGKP